MATHPERELFEPVDLCTRSGRLDPAAIGWSRRPLHRCRLRGHWLARKRWNYWAVSTESHFFSATLADLDYVGLVGVCFADFEALSLREKTSLVPLARGFRLPDGVEESVSFESREIRLAFLQEESRVRLCAEVADLDGAHLSAEFTVSVPERHETLNVVIPWSPRRFQFTSKQNTLPARGYLRLGTGEVAFDGLESFACLDFGRGVWPRSIAWNWGTASGMRAGRSIGLNLGGRWTDGTGMTENALCIDGRLSKLSEALVWELDRLDFMKPWRIRTPESGRVNLTFTPFLERASSTRIGPLGSEMHQLFGHYNGIVTTVDGEHVAIGDLVGSIEDHVARW